MSSKTFNLVGGNSSGIKLVSISIINPPNKVNYKPGEIFDPAGMQIQAVYSNEATVIATGWTFTPDTPLTEDINNITILYSEGGITVQIQQIITVTKKILQIPTQKGVLTYNGGIQSPSWNNYNDSEILLSGTTSNINAGTYIAKFSLKDPIGTQWSDGSSIEKEVVWNIQRATISSIPIQSGSLTYNGYVQSPSWTGYDSSKMTIGGTTSSTNAGTFTANFTPTNNYQWNDNSITTKNANWTIEKAAGSLALSTSNVNLNATTKSKTVTVTRAGDGAITATSNATGVATVSVSGTTLTITGKSTGNATITVKVAAGINHNAPANKTIAVNVELWDWGSESAIGDSSWWENLKTWAIKASPSERKQCVGKKKKVNLSTAVLGANQASMICIGADQDGTGTLTFQTEGLLPDSTKFGITQDWPNSIVKTQCQNFYNYCSAKNSIKTVKKGLAARNSSRNGSVSYYSENVWLPSEREMGLDTYSSLSTANSTTSKAECTQGYNAAYSYYTSDSKRIKCLMNNSGSITSSTGWHWERSRDSEEEYKVCRVRTIGSADSVDCEKSNYIAPAFVIG